MGRGGRKERPQAPAQVVARRWRDYVTASGRRPVKDFLRGLSDDDAEGVLGAMGDVRKNGLDSARHLREEIYEVRADGVTDDYRVLFAKQGRRSQILLSLVAMTKHTQKTPDHEIDLANRRLRDWEQRGRARRKQRPGR